MSQSSLCSCLPSLFYGCLSLCCCSILCCHCNCVIFPAPAHEEDHGEYKEAPRYSNQSFSFDTFLSNDRQVPYMKMWNDKSIKSNKCLLYFHGNAEDLNGSRYFLAKILSSLSITIYSMEYPGYGTYNVKCTGSISSKIKADSLNFYDHIKKITQSKQEPNNIIVMGRSIGSGGACYLAGNRPIEKLILMSPFDTIKKAAYNIVGCLGYIVHQHFNNQYQIEKHKGNLLIIHGEKDEVISVESGRNLASLYKDVESLMIPMEIYPQRMTHNSFQPQRDIITPILSFLRESQR